MKSFIEQIKKTIKNLDKEIIEKKRNINNDLEGIIGKTKTILYLLNEDILSAERFYKKAKAIDPILEEVKALKSFIDDKKKEE